ncbi:MAG: hypothetical protein GY795_06885 [Desulfobacterales bacterium]|nr:hypothetical protein [Desulfobacterales bacterium]
MKRVSELTHDFTQSESQMTADYTDYADDPGRSGRADSKTGDFRSGEKPLQAVISEASA